MNERTMNIVCLVLTAAMVVAVIADLPPATWVNQWQVWVSGGYHPKLTALILIAGVLGLYVAAYTVIQSVGEAVDDPVERDRLARKFRRGQKVGREDD